MSVAGRLLVALVVGATVVAGGAALERLGPRRQAVASLAAERSGAWFCPHGGGEQWRVWLAVANPGQEHADLEITTFGKGRPRTSRDTLAPGTQRLLQVEAPSLSSGSVVEFFGGPVFAGMLAARPEEGGLAAEPCSSRAGPRWFVPEGTAARGQQPGLVVMNPFRTDAVLDISLVGREEVIEPGALEGLVVPPGRTVAFDLNRFALGQETLAVEVATVLGRVAVAGVHASPGGIRQVIGVDVLAHRWILPGGSEEGPSELEVFAALPGPAAFQARAEGEGGEAPAIDEEQIPGRSARTFDIEVPGATVVVESEGGQPFAAGRLLAAEAADPAETPAREETGGPGQGSGGGGGGKGTPGSSRDTGRQGGGREEKEETEASDLAVTSGVSEPAPAWVVLPAAAEGPGVLIVDNPTSVPATVEISLLAQEGPVGPAGASPLEVPPATSLVVDLSENGNLPAAVVVRCTSGTVAAAQAASGPDGFAVTVGIPVDPSLSF